MKNMNSKRITKITASALLATVALYTTPVFAFTKDETVYSKLDNTGKPYQTIVNSQLKNIDELDTLQDVSNLFNIKNVGGNETFTQNGNELVWQANGKDIFYQGEANHELPIDCIVTYTLDGEKIEPQDLVGKSGKVQITIAYTNKEKHSVTINGKDETMYTPFVVACGTIFSNRHCKNVEISSGKVIDDGDKSIVLGITMPGMQESLGISENKLEIPSKVEISMDAEEFEMNGIYGFASPKLLDEDLDLSKLNQIYDMANTLKDASTQLVDGSNQLNDGAKQVNAGTQELAKQLNAKISLYNKARKDLANKQELEKQIIAVVNAEITKLAPELKELAKQEADIVIKENNEEIKDKTAKTALAYSKEAIQNTKLSNETMKLIEKDIQVALANIQKKDDVKALEAQIKQLVIADVTNTVKSTTADVITTKVDGMKNTISDPTALLDSTTKAQLNAAEEQMAQAMVPGLMSQGLTQDQALAQARKSVSTLVTTVSKGTMDATLDAVAKEAPTMAESEVKKVVANLSVDGALEQAISTYIEKVTVELAGTLGADTLNAIKDNIKKEIIQELEKSFASDKALQAQLGQSIDAVAEKTARTLADELAEDLTRQIANNLIEKQLSGELTGTELDRELNKYAGIIDAQLNEVDGEITVLKNGLTQLTDGTNALSDGANQLADGMTQFDADGIQKIYDLVNGDVKDMQARIEKLQELANDYNTFTMNNEETGSVKFILMIDSIKEDSKKQEAIVTSTNTDTPRKEDTTSNK